MSEYLDRAKALRADETRHYNCAQAVLVPFADAVGVPEEVLFRTAANFGSGMRTGAVCGAVTGALMALGLMGIEDPAAVQALLRAVREKHEGCIDCRDLLRLNAQRGGERKPHCDGMVFELVELTERIRKEHGLD